MRNQILKTLAILFCFFSFQYLIAQSTPQSATLNVNNVKVVVNSNGALFWDFQDGQFIAPFTEGSDEISTMRSSGLWISGLDPGGNLKGAIQLYNDNNLSDFLPGLIVNNEAYKFNNIWRVKSTDITEHLNDFADNGIIDNPNPSVFGWPATGNVHFASYNNGLELPLVPQGLASFFDNNADGLYNPNDGDYPIADLRGCDFPNVPTEMLWFSFHDYVEHTQSTMDPMKMEIQCTVFAYECADEESPLSNSVFVRHKVINLAQETIDSCYIGVFNDFDIGNPNDDFFGTSPQRSLVYGYNGDEQDEGAFESESPVMAVDFLRGVYNNVGEEMPISFIQPYDVTSALQPLQYYNLLSGSTETGDPAPYNGLYYPDNPNDSNGNSEVSLGNTPGNRATISSYGPLTLQPGVVNEMLIAYSSYHEAGNTPLQNVNAMIPKSDQVQAFFDNCFSNVICNPPVLPTEELFLSVGNIFPNPTNDKLFIALEKHKLSSLQISDLNGRQVEKFNWLIPEKNVELSLAQLHQGVYILALTTDNGQRFSRKIVILN